MNLFESDHLRVVERSEENTVGVPNQMIDR